MIKALIRQNRSYRRFNQEYLIGNETLRALIELAVLSPSAANLQALKYILSNMPQKNELIFPALSWAGYLTDWPGPAAGERPSAYIIVLGDTEIGKTFFQVDAGIACQSILLGAVAQGLGGCILGSIDRERLRKNLAIPARFEILYVIALGQPQEKVVIEKVGSTGDIKYWRDQAQVHHVPKRPLEEIILSEYSGYCY